MAELISTTPGLYPLPDWAKETLQDLKGNQKDDLIGGDERPEIVAAYDRARADIITQQTDAGLDRIVEGQARWDDMLAHPLAVADNVETHGIVRYYDNNNFYRDPVVTGELTPTGDVAAELDAAAEHLDGESLQAVLPGPYSLADLATDEFYDDESSFLAAVASFLAGEAGEFPDVETLFLLEPSLVTAPPSAAVAERLPDLLDTVTEAVSCDVVVHPYWGALTDQTNAYVMDASIDGLGFDLVTDPETNLYNAQEYGTPDDVALGVVDGQNTRVESPETIRERIDWFEGNTPQNDYETVYATTNTETFYLPVNRAVEKLEALGTAPALEVTA